MPSRSLFPQACVSSGSSVVGLIVTSSKRLMPYPGLLHPEPLPLQQSTADPYLCRRHSNTVLSQSLWGLWVLVHTRFVWALQASLVGRGFDSKCNFAPLPSCWGFSFALGHGVSFFGGIQQSSIGGFSTASCKFGVIAGEEEYTSFCCSC